MEKPYIKYKAFITLWNAIEPITTLEKIGTCMRSEMQKETEFIQSLFIDRATVTYETVEELAFPF